MNKLLFITLALLMSGSASAQEKPEPPPYGRGIEAFQAKDYERAIKLFEMAFEVSPDKQTLFAWAQAERLSGDCKAATILYNRLLRMAPSAKQAAVVSQALAECERELTSEQLKEVRDELAKLDIKPAKEEPTEGQEKVGDKQMNAPIIVEKRVVERGASRTPSYFFMAAGIVGIGVGTTFAVLARSANQRDAATFQERLDNADLADSRQTLSTISFIGGGAVLATGVVWFLLTGGESEDEAPLSSWVSPNSAGITFSGSF